MGLQLLFRITIFCGVSIYPSMQNVIDLHIGTLIPGLSNRQDDFGYMTAIELAAETINSQSILSGYRLVFHHKDTLLDPSWAIESLFEFRNDNASSVVKICILGPSTSEIAALTAPLATVWGTLQVSYGASDLEFLSDKYPRFLSTVPTSNSLNKAVIGLMKYFNWKRVALAYGVEKKEFYLANMNALKDILVANKMEILIQEGIDLKIANDKKLFIQNLKEKDVRIVIALLDNDSLIKTMCEAYKQGFYGDRIVWITYLVPLMFHKKLSNPGCNESEFRAVSEGTFNLDIQYLRTDRNKTISGLTAANFKRKIHARRRGRRTFGPAARYPLAFDTTWLLALSLNASLQDATEMQALNPKLRRDWNKYIALTEKLRQRMISMDFEGISGRVKFNSSERLGTIVIKQQRKGRPVNVAEHHTASNALTFYPNQSKPEVLFKGTRYLQDGPRHINQSRHYSLILFTVIWVVCSLGIIVALALFYFNFKNREIRYIKMSSPHVNNIIIFGGLLCYIKVILDTLDSRFFGLETFAQICNARVWLMSLGFTTAFGAMFSKTWRVHRIFTASKNFRRAVIKNFHLYGLLFALLAVDCILLTVWMGVSPYQYGTLELPSEEKPEEDEVIHPYIFNCTSEYENYFLITTLGCKGLLLAFGIFLAWETRNIEIKALNDSKYIGISVYNVVVLSVVGAILATVISRTDYYNVYLALMSLVVILCTAATLGIVFVPKIIGLQRILNSSTKDTLETTYSVRSSGDNESPCCCCEACKCKCSGIGNRKASIHVSNKFLAGSSSNSRRKTRTASVPSISVTKPNVSLHINARVSLSAYPISESPMASPEESPRVGFLSSVNEA